MDTPWWWKSGYSPAGRLPSRLAPSIQKGGSAIAAAATTATRLAVFGATLVAAKANAMIRAAHATPSTAADTRMGDLRRSSRDNVDMPAVSQGLVEFANQHRDPPAPGIELIVTPSYPIKPK